MRDPDLQKTFDKDGYVLIDLLNEKEVQELFELLASLSDAKNKTGFTVDSSYKLSFFSDSPEYRKLVFEKISDFFREKVNKYLLDYDFLIINLFDKEPGGGEVPVHQNWTFVDESKYTSVSVWIPLIDVTRENGTLEVVKGSHRVLTPYRSPSIPWVFKDLFDPLRKKYLEPLNLKVGQAGIIDDSIIHWSSENKSQKVRSTIQLIMKPKEATPIHYYRDQNAQDKLEIYEVDSQFFTTFKMNEKPENVKKIGSADFSYKNLTEQEMLEKIAQNNPDILEKAV